MREELTVLDLISVVVSAFVITATILGFFYE